MQDFGIFGLKIIYFALNFLKKIQKSINSFNSLVLVIINLEIIRKKLLSILYLFETLTLNIHKISKFIVIDKDKNLVFITF